MMSTAYNYNETPLTAVALGSLLILFIITDLTNIQKFPNASFSVSPDTFMGAWVSVRCFVLFFLDQFLSRDR